MFVQVLRFLRSVDFFSRLFVISLIYCIFINIGHGDHHYIELFVHLIVMAKRMAESAVWYE